MLKRLAVMLLVVGLVGSAGGCGPPEKKTEAACGASIKGVHESGPLQGLPGNVGGNAPTMVQADKPTPQPALRIPLVVKGTQPVVIDCVILDPFREFSSLPAPVLPRLDAAKVVTAEQSRPAKGFQLSAGSQDQSPWLLLSVSTGQKIAFNQDTQVFYHTPDGTKYRAVYLVQFVVCVKGEVTPHSCLRAFPRYVKAYNQEQQRSASAGS